MKRFLFLLMILLLAGKTALAAEGNLNTAKAQAISEAGKTTAYLVENIDLEEFASHYGISLSPEDETLIRIALMAYSNGAILEHPVGIKPVRLASMPDDPYVGNRNSKKFHYSWCSSVSDIKEKNKVPFSSVQAAEEAGYEPCKKCNPGN